MTVTQADGWPAAPARVPDRMQAVVFRRFGGPEVLEAATLTTPQPGPSEMLVKVPAVSVGRAIGVTSRAGRHPFVR